jgi:hypothetical protein
MREKTWQAVNAYRAKFGKDFCDLSKVTNSQETQLILDINEELKKPVPKKKKKQPSELPLEWPEE